MCVCVSRICVNLCCCPVLPGLLAVQDDEQELGSVLRVLVLKCRQAMYRSASLLESKEVMALYGEDRDRYCVKDEDCISEVRGLENAAGSLCTSKL